MLQLGTKAPDFTLPDQNGVLHSLEEYRGKKVVLYFYPKDNTPGCTKQACGFAELYPQFTEKGAVVIGVSKDSAASHKKFVVKGGMIDGTFCNAEKLAELAAIGSKENAISVFLSTLQSPLTQLALVLKALGEKGSEEAAA